jgi:molybdopterin-dependent oxidoreductase alpha subunit
MAALCYAANVFARLWQFLQRIIPFGLLVRTKPRHYLEMLKVLWENRGRWLYAWRILRHGVCDGCSLGPRGLRDDVLPGIHLCISRLKLLKLNTRGPIPSRSLVRDDLGLLSNERLHQLGRVPYPLFRGRGEQRFRRLSWDEATTIVADRLRTSDPERVGFFVTSRGITNETYYVTQKLARLAGTPHIDSCARLCHAASGVGLKQTIGWGAPTISLSDLVGSDLIFVIGSNLANNQPVSTKYLYAARKAGSYVVVINPFREPALERYWIPSIPSSALFGSTLMDEYLAVRPGGDIAFMTGVLKALDAANGFDQTFIEQHTLGFDALVESLRGTSWEEIEREAGVERALIEALAERYRAARSAVFVYSMGLTQYEFGVENVKMVANLALARGMIGRRHCGILPIRGHSGVQGAAECGADADKLPGSLEINEENCERLEKEYGHPIPHRAGLRAAHLLERAGETGLDVLYLVGGNHLETMPDPRHARSALANVGLRVHQDIVLNSSTLLESKGDVLVLPAQTRYEQRSGGTSTSTERRIRFSPEIPGPRIEEARPEWEIPALIGQKLFPDRNELFHYEDTGQVRAEMARVMPLYAGIERLEKEGDSLQWGGERLGSEGFPNMPEGKAHFSVVAIPRIEVPEGQFLLTMRRGKQFNSMTYGERDPLTGGSERHSILLDRRDMQELGIVEGDRVLVKSDVAVMDATARSGPCRRGHVQGFWPECNALLSRRYDPASGEPDYNTHVVIERQWS